MVTLWRGPAEGIALVKEFQLHLEPLPMAEDVKQCTKLAGKSVGQLEEGLFEEVFITVEIVDHRASVNGPQHTTDRLFAAAT